MIATTLYVRVVPQDRDRGYMLLVGYDSAVVQRTAVEYITLTNITRADLDRVIALMKKSYRATEVRDCTNPGIVKKLKVLFGETPEKPAEPNKEA
jgi:hypothetical protein